MKSKFMLHTIQVLRKETKQNLTKESVIDQFTQLIESADPTTLEFLSCQLSLLQSFMESGDKDENQN